MALNRAKKVKKSEARVLVVEDSTVMRSMAKKTLRLAGVSPERVEESGDGAAALQLMEQTPVDVVLADINMPVMDGAEMLRRMRASKKLRDIPVVIVSSECNRARAALLQSRGANAHLRKPYTPEQLKDILDEILEDESD